MADTDAAAAPPADAPPAAAAPEEPAAAAKPKAARAKKEKPAAEPKAEAAGEEAVPSRGSERKRSKPQQLYESLLVPAEKKEIEIPDGKGTALGDIPNVRHYIDKRTSKDLKPVHTILYGARGHERDFKDHLRRFKGFVFANDAERKKKVAALESKKTNDLKDLASVLDVERSGSKEEIVQRIMEFLENPRDSGRKLTVTPRKSPKSKKTASKGKGKAKKAKKEDKGGPKRPLTAFMFFAGDRRAALKEANPGDSVTVIASKLGELWGKMSDDDKKKYTQQAAQDRERYERELKAWEASGGAKSSPKKSPKKAAVKKAAAKKTKASPKKKAAESSSEDSSDDSASSDSSEEEEKPKPKAKARSPAKPAKRKAAESDSDDDQPLAKKAKSGPTDEEVKAAIVDIVSKSDLEQLTKRNLKEKIASKFPTFDVVARKDDLNEWIGEACQA
eukprot:Opistho-1_new@2980